MDVKISSCTGFALPVLLLSVALIACGDKTTTSGAPLAVTVARYNATGAPGTPDTSFGTQGVVMTDVNASQDDIAFAVVLQPGGKIIAVGTSFTAPASIVVIRYNANGTLDSTFGSNGNGITVTSLPLADASAFAATLDADGKLLVAGRSIASSGATGFLLLRYHTNSNLITGTPGTLDTAGFNSPLGYVATPIPSGTETSANGIALSGTNILLAGQSKIGGKFQIVLAQYTPTGALDTTGFGGGTGIVTTPIGALDAAAAALAVQPLDGKIVVAGLAGNAFTNVWDAALLRYNANGTLDLPFGGTNTGMAITDIGSSSNYANAVALQADGKIVVAGNAFANPSANTSDFAVLRYNTDGSLDKTGFGSPNGYVTTSVGAFDNGYAVAVQTDNKIVVAGNADAGVGDRLALLRYNADGSPDLGFGTAGIVTRAASGPSIITGAFGVALQPSDGAIVVVGYD